MIKRLGQNTVIKLFRLFDSEGEGFIPVTRFREILKEVDEDFTDSELDDIIAEVSTEEAVIFLTDYCWGECAQ